MTAEAPFKMLQEFPEDRALSPSERRIVNQKKHILARVREGEFEYVDEVLEELGQELSQAKPLGQAGLDGIARRNIGHIVRSRLVTDRVTTPENKSRVEARYEWSFIQQEADLNQIPWERRVSINFHPQGYLSVTGQEEIVELDLDVGFNNRDAQKVLLKAITRRMFIEDPLVMGVASKNLQGYL